jgi:hypothetical protein
VRSCRNTIVAVIAGYKNGPVKFSEDRNGFENKKCGARRTVFRPVELQVCLHDKDKNKDDSARNRFCRSRRIP